MVKKPVWTKVNNATYTKVMTCERRSEMFHALLGRGYFPRQLPPPFESKGFEKAARAFSKEFKETISNELHNKRAITCRYSLARPGQLRRVLSIPHPAFHYLISLKAAEIFPSLELEVSSPSDQSLSFPKFEKDKRNRAFEFTEAWDRLPLRRLKQRAQGKYIVKADIARFFPSVYTHSIAWAFHGKAAAKNDTSNIEMEGNYLDLLIRNSQDGQTLGIPIGPDTSFIISEKILFEIDKLVVKKLKGKKIKFFHRADDYEFVCMSRQDADFCISALQGALQTFELELNTLKTAIFSLPHELQDPEVSALRNFDLGAEPSTNKLLEYYDLAFKCFKSYPKGTLKYAIKRIPHDDFYDDTISDFMAQSMFLEPGVIEAVFTWLAKADCLDKVDKNSFVFCLSSIIKEHSILGHTSEVAWAIWGFLLLKAKISDETAEEIAKMNDPLVLLLALDAKEKGLIKSKAIGAAASELMSAESLYDHNWMLAYEAPQKRWVKKSDTQHVESDPIFKLFKSAGVSFYNSQDVSDYQEIMKDWEPYNPYGDLSEHFEVLEDDEDDDEDEDDDDDPNPYEY